MMKKALLIISVMLLFISSTILPGTAQMTLIQNIELQEAATIEQFMDEIEHTASESQSSDDFTEKIQALCLETTYKNCTILDEFILKLTEFLTKERRCIGGRIHLQDLLEKIYSKFSSNYLVISYGTYNRLNPWKENSIDFFKGGLSMWRYSGPSTPLKPRTFILERQPFEIHQKLSGLQIGFMMDFKGIYLNIESKLTGKAYIFFVGRVDHIRAFDLTPFSQ